MTWPPIFCRPDKAELPGWEAPYREEDDGRKAASFFGGGAFKVQVALAAAKGVITRVLAAGPEALDSVA
jgi:hypothetical protein